MGYERRGEVTGNQDQSCWPEHALTLEGPVRIWLVELHERGKSRMRVMTSSQTFHEVLALDGDQIFRCSVIESADSFDDTPCLRSISKVWHRCGAPVGHVLYEGNGKVYGDGCTISGLRTADLVWSAPHQPWDELLADSSPPENMFELRGGEAGLLMSWRELVSKFPYMFPRDLATAFDFYRGWFPLFVRTCTYIDTILSGNTRNFHWVHAAEKLGGARYRYSLDGQIVVIADTHRLHADFLENPGPSDFAARRIYAAVESAIKSSEKTCMHCGRPAVLSGLKGAPLCLCSVHLDDALLANVWEASRVELDPV